MTLHIDPEGNEIEALRKAAGWRGKRVLEIGCGEGRLTQRLARLGANVYAIEPDAAVIRKARASLPRPLANKVVFKTGHAERLRHRDESFDTVVFAWSL